MISVWCRARHNDSFQSMTSVFSLAVFAWVVKCVQMCSKKIHFTDLGRSLEVESAKCVAAQSPDLNPIEHVWEHLKTKLRSRLSTIASILELEFHPPKNGQRWISLSLINWLNICLIVWAGMLLRKDIRNTSTKCNSYCLIFIEVNSQGALLL